MNTMIINEKDLRPYRVKTKKLIFRQPSPEEKTYIDSRDKSVSRIASIFVFAAFFIFDGILVFSQFPLWIILLVTGFLLISFLPELLRKKKYGVCSAYLVRKHPGDDDSPNSVDIWSDENQQYCKYISWNGGYKEFQQLQPGDELVIYLSRHGFFAERPRGYVPASDNDFE